MYTNIFCNFSNNKLGDMHHVKIGDAVKSIQHHYFPVCPPFALVWSRSSRTLRDEGEVAQPAAPGQTQGQLYLRQHRIKPIIHHQGLLSVKVDVLFMRLKSAANTVSGGRNCKHVFLSPPYKRIKFKKKRKKKKLVLEDLVSEKLFSGVLRCTHKPIAKSLQLKACAFIFHPKSPWRIKLSLNLNKTITPNQSEFISSEIIPTASQAHRESFQSPHPNTPVCAG